MDILLGVGGVLVLALILLVIGLSKDRRGGQDLVDARVGTREGRRPRRATSERRGSVVGAAVDRAIAGRGFAQNLAAQIAQANLKWTVGEFLIMTIVLSALAGLLFYLIHRNVLIPIGLIGGFFGPRVYLGVRRSARLKAFNEQLSDALNLMVNSLRAGYSVTQAMEVIANEMPAPISEEFGRAIFELQLGVDFDTAMANLLRRMPSQDMDLVITAMSVQREVGGNLAEVLDAISFTIRERVRIKGELKTLTAQGRITGLVITFLPFVLGGFIYLVNPDFMSVLFTDPCGWVMIGISLILIALGYFVISKIVSIEV